MVDILLLVGRAVLALVFALSAAGKLADLAGARRAVAGFGVPVRFANPIGTALPFAELALAILLVPAATAWWAGLGALLLLLGFTAAMGISLARGERPDCHCFGAIHSEPVGKKTVLRNGGLVAIAAVVVGGGRADPGPGVFDRLAGADPVDAALIGAALTFLTALGFGGITVWALYRRLATIDAQLEVARAAGATTAAPTGDEDEKDAILHVPVGTPLPPFSASSLAGETVSFEDELHRGRQLLIVFVNAACSACERILPRIGRWQNEVGDHVKVLVVSHGDVAENRAKAERTHFPQARYLVQDGHEVSETFGVERVPLALHVAPDGSLMSPVKGGAEAITGLLDEILVQVETRRPVTPNPVLKRVRAAFGAGAKLPDLTGLRDGAQPVQLPMPGRRTLMIFWNPGCPFCQRFSLQLRAWEKHVPDDLAVVLLVKPGEAAATREHGLNATIVEDDGALRAHYEVSGTPVAVLAAADGTLAAPMAFGLGATQALLQDANAIDAELRAS